VRALADAVDHATDRYRQGLASYYEVIEAQQQLSIPRRSRSRRFAKTASSPMFASTRHWGGGWSLSDALWTAQQHEMAR
jgi:hypothetical protein